MGASSSTDNLEDSTREASGPNVVSNDNASDSGSAGASEGSRAGNCRRLARFVFGGSDSTNHHECTTTRHSGTCSVAGVRISASEYECIERLERAGQTQRAARLRHSRQTLTALPRKRSSASSSASGASGGSGTKYKEPPAQLPLRLDALPKQEDLKDTQATNTGELRVDIAINAGHAAQSADGAKKDVTGVCIATPMAATTPPSHQQQADANTHFAAGSAELTTTSMPADSNDKGLSSAERGLSVEQLDAPFFTNDSEQTTRGYIWNGSRILLYYLQSPEQARSLHGMRVLEFGSGLGHLGYGLARLGAHVTCSEHRGACPLLKVNLRDLEAEHGTAAEKGGSLRAVELNWGEAGFKESELAAEMDAGAPPFDVLIAAELFWLDDLHDDLIWSWRHFAASHTLIYSIYINRPLSWCFFEKLRGFDEFEVEELRIGVDVHPCNLGEQLPVHVHRIRRRRPVMDLIAEVEVPSFAAAAVEVAPEAEMPVSMPTSEKPHVLSQLHL